MYGKRTSSKLKEPDSHEHGYSYALFLLNLRLRTEGEVRTKMQERGYAPAVVNSVLEQLKTNSYVDDFRYAEVLIDNFKRFKTYGLYIIKKKMFEKRLPKEVIETSVQENLSVPEEMEIAKKYMNKQGLNIGDAKEYADRQKIAYKLSQRGFRGEVVSRVFSGEVPEVD